MLMKKILTMVTKDRYLSLFQRVHLAYAVGFLVNCGEKKRPNVASALIE